MVPYAQPADDPGGHPKLPDGEDPVNVSYSWALARWLPVRAEWVAADGSHYAYSDRVGTLHAVDARAGRDRRLNGDRAWAVIAYEPEGIYAGAASVSSPAAAGLWLVDPATGRLRQLQSAGAWQYVHAGAAWALNVTRPSVTPKYTPADGLYGDTLVRLDLQSGKTATLYARSDTELRMVGLDSDGNPYVTELAQGPTSLLEVTGPGRVVQTGSGAWVNAARDDGRTWFGENYGPSVWLKDSAGIRAVVGPGSGQVRVAGGCH